jgi:hypothetical protein
MATSLIEIESRTSDELIVSSRFGRLSVEMLFRSFCLGFCRMHCFVAVLRGAIESVESQWLAACVDDVVASARWH